MLTHEHEISELKKKTYFYKETMLWNSVTLGLQEKQIALTMFDIGDHSGKKKKNLGNLVTLSCDQKVDAKQNQKECGEKMQIPE